MLLVAPLTAMIVPCTCTLTFPFRGLARASVTVVPAVLSVGGLSATCLVKSSLPRFFTPENTWYSAAPTAEEELTGSLKLIVIAVRPFLDRTGRIGPTSGAGGDVCVWFWF